MCCHSAVTTTMTILGHSLLLVIVVILFSHTKGEEMMMAISPEVYSRSQYACVGLSKEPSFSLEVVIGQPWRIYYTWNMKMEQKCVDVHFQAATPEIIKRMYYDMFSRVKEQPLWDSATLLVSMSKDGQEMLLIPEGEIPGRFQAVNSGLRDFMAGQKIPLLRLQIKLLQYSKFLLFVDCYVGIAWLALRVEKTGVPFRMDVESEAAKVARYLGNGYHACTADKNDFEYVVQPEDNNKKQPEMPKTNFNDVE